MATAAEKKKAYEEWKERCRQVQAITDTSLLKSETPVERDMRIKRLLNNYAAFCELLLSGKTQKSIKILPEAP